MRLAGCVQGIAVGSRAHLHEKDSTAKRKWYRVILMKGFHALVSLVIGGGDIKDTQCGFKLFSRYVDVPPSSQLPPPPTLLAHRRHILPSTPPMYCPPPSLAAASCRSPTHLLHRSLTPDSLRASARVFSRLATRRGTCRDAVVDSG
jgi:hypothetical protein